MTKDNKPVGRLVVMRGDRVPPTALRYSHGGGSGSRAMALHDAVYWITHYERFFTSEKGARDFGLYLDPTMPDHWCVVYFPPGTGAALVRPQAVAAAAKALFNFLNPEGDKET